ncbi:hypothetical protein E2C01_052622 [Portunus trituberculatus]|uniref:Uncharacterized protein n=1 Tax=Portunus trituberculatus TaxID=210409 RepID=A0A5B7GME0_PORTR|nr:hypothetical protein [Portunus trituberculatus]
MFTSTSFNFEQLPSFKLKVAQMSYVSLLMLNFIHNFKQQIKRKVGESSRNHTCCDRETQAEERDSKPQVSISASPWSHPSPGECGSSYWGVSIRAGCHLQRASGNNPSICLVKVSSRVLDGGSYLGPLQSSLIRSTEAPPADPGIMFRSSALFKTCKRRSGKTDAKLKCDVMRRVEMSVRC